MDRSSTIYVAGHGGLVGSAICRRLVSDGYSRLIVRDHAQLDLTNRAAVNAFFAAEKPEYVFLAAAKVGGILANSTQPVGERIKIASFAFSASALKLPSMSRSDSTMRLKPSAS